MKAEGLREAVEMGGECMAKSLPQKSHISDYDPGISPWLSSSRNSPLSVSYNPIHSGSLSKGTYSKIPISPFVVIGILATTARGQASFKVLKKLIQSSELYCGILSPSTWRGVILKFVSHGR